MAKEDAKIDTIEDRLAKLETVVSSLRNDNASLTERLLAAESANEELADRLISAEAVSVATRSRSEPQAPRESNPKGLWRFVRGDPTEIASIVFNGDVDAHLAELHAMARRHNPATAPVFAERLRRLGHKPNVSGDYDAPAAVKPSWVAHLGQTA